MALSVRACERSSWRTPASSSTRLRSFTGISALVPLHDRSTRPPGRSPR
jgi:hypothetical protein